MKKFIWWDGNRFLVGGSCGDFALFLSCLLVDLSGKVLMGYLQIPFLLLVLGLIAPFLGSTMAKIFRGQSCFLSPVCAPIEKLTYRLCRIDPKEEMGWKTYLLCLVLFNALGFAVLFLILVLQHYLPFNPAHFQGTSFFLSLNCATSFATNSDWQAYAPENTLSYTAQMAGLSVQNFLSAASGNSVLLALIRGFVRRTGNTLGNFWVDVTRTVVYLLLPLSILLALFFVSQGVVQTLSGYVEAETVEGGRQIIPLGPAASQIAIKQIGSNGGGFFNVNSCHPFENPTPLTNFVQLVFILALPISSIIMFGELTGRKKHAKLLILSLFFLYAAGLVIALYSELQPNPLINAYPLMEGKELRIGPVNSILWSTATTASSNGSVNAMLDSLSPLSGGVALLNLMVGELIFGGVGAGLINLAFFILLTLFLAGLMVGRTPEYMGKKVEKKEMQWVSLAILFPPFLILVGSATALLHPQKVLNAGPHSLSAILYVFASCVGNNGSAFAGLETTDFFYNIVTAFCMTAGRFVTLCAALALAGSLVRKQRVPYSPGAFSTETLLFVSLLVGVIVIVGALSFFPVLCLGPLAEQILMVGGRGFQ